VGTNGDDAMDTQSTPRSVSARLLIGSALRRPVSGVVASGGASVSAATQASPGGPERSTGATERPRDSWVDRDAVWLLLAAGVLGAAVMWVMHNALVDDAFITLDYARSLAHRGEWGLLPGVPANTATSPLNVMVLSAITVVVRSPMVALWIVSIVNPMVLALGLLKLGRRWDVGARFAWVALPILVLNPLLASSIGLETMLVVTATVWLLERAGAGDPKGFGWLAGISVVLRPDVVVVVAVIWLCSPALRRSGWRSSTATIAWRAALVGLPWYAFSWIYFGSAVPDTLVIKQSQHWGTFWEGLVTRQRELFPLPVDATLLLAGLGLLVLVCTPLLARTSYRPVLLGVASAGIAGIASYGLFCFLDVPPYFWYYGLPTAALSLLAAWAIAAASSRLMSTRAVVVSQLLCAALLLGAIGPALASWAVNLSHSAPLRRAPVFGNWASTPEYKSLGLRLAKRFPSDTVIRSAGEFGTILYYCDCLLLDRFDSRGLIMDKLTDARDGSALMRLNYLFLDPADYPVVHQDYHLSYRRGHSPGKHAFNVFTPSHGHGHYRIKAGPRPEDADQGLAP